MRPTKVIVGRKYVSGRIQLFLPLDKEWTPEYGRDGLRAYYDEKDGTLTIYVHRELGEPEKLLLKLKGSNKGREELAKKLNDQ